LVRSPYPKAAPMRQLRSRDGEGAGAVVAATVLAAGAASGASDCAWASDAKPHNAAILKTFPVIRMMKRSIAQPPAETVEKCADRGRAQFLTK
jgi:hypothetical protein